MAIRAGSDKIDRVTSAPRATPPDLEPPSPPDAPADATSVATGIATAMVDAVGTVVAGRRETAEVAVACLLSRGHLLIEDIPGVGKTLLAQSLAASIGGTFHRVQGTPDLLPGDVTGSMVPHGDDFELRFRPGPVFANVVVFDELNRANPRTQSALLEVAEESTVSVDGTTRPLPSPFLLIATQNPYEMTGTYELGEGALDRFTAVVAPGRVSPDEEVEVLTGRFGRGRLASVRPVASVDDVVAAQRAVAGVRVTDAVARYVVSLLEATRSHPRVRLGASTRAGVALVGLARSLAVMRGRGYVVPDDVVAAAVPALSHRVISLDAGASVRAGRDVVVECLAQVAAPTA
jgi:MoxR-like ATPase